MSKQEFFIGYGSFEDFLAASPSSTVYISKSVSTLPTDIPMIKRVNWSVTAAAVSDGICHYWRMKLGSLDSFDDLSPVEAEYSKKCDARATQAMELLTEIAREYGYRVVRGLLAIPENLSVMTGTATSLRFDKEKNLFERVVFNTNPQVEKQKA